MAVVDIKTEVMSYVVRIQYPFEFLPKKIESLSCWHATVRSPVTHVLVLNPSFDSSSFII